MKFSTTKKIDHFAAALEAALTGPRDADKEETAIQAAYEANHALADEGLAVRKDRQSS